MNKDQEFLEYVVKSLVDNPDQVKAVRTVDEMGNYTLGIKEHTIFPETADEDLKDVFGLAATIVTTSKDKKHTLFLLEYLGFPMKKEEKPFGPEGLRPDGKEEVKK